MTKRIIETGLDRGVLYPNSGPAVPWEGLTSVDEGGADGAAAYYVDGRPFLFLPKPKEYTANLKAYTYPDEFAVIQGLAEATEGMFLDSQQGDSFGLSYRTLIGNATQGLDFGYKIHLVYNATVTPSGNSYNTLSSSINPSELSWEIQAVPAPVPGYRATAHVIIDTRNMDPVKLAQVEDLIYGTSTTEASLPSAQEIFDILKFGDTIVITDNGDGTWDAVGSYHNIYLIGDGVFQIDNVNAVDNGDGTFYIATTPAGARRSYSTQSPNQSFRKGAIMVLPDVAVGDAHVLAHNAERARINIIEALAHGCSAG
jgi:hypothetical protein